MRTGTMMRTVPMMKITRLNDNVEVLQCAEWMGDCNISHFMTTRFGGVSEGAFGGMNAGRYTEDNPAHVQANIALLCDAFHLHPERLIMPHQTHGARIYRIDEPFLHLPKEEQAEALEGVDALMTDLPEMCVAVSTADCVPVLLYAPDKRAVAAVHAGWRGMVGAIIRKAVRAMQREYGCDAGRMQAVVGPSISQPAFEVGDEVVEQFRRSEAWTETGAASLFWQHPMTGKTHIDLWRAAYLQLTAEGLTDEHLHFSNVCTYQHSTQFFSARRLGVRSGRILSGICLRTGR